MSTEAGEPRQETPPGVTPGVVLDDTTRFPVDPNGPENPVHSLDVFSRGLPFDPKFTSGFRKRQTEIQLSESAMRQVMLGVDVRPHSLVMNPRAHIFPEKIEAVVFHTKSSIFDQTLQTMAEYEAFNRRTVGHPFSYGEVQDVRKVSRNDTFIPYGFWRGSSTFLGGEVWQVKRRDKRADALQWFLDQRAQGRGEGNPLSDVEISQLPHEEQMQHYRFLSDFGTIDIDDYPPEQQPELISKIRAQQDMLPFINTNYYRVNYYSAPGGDFFFSDILPDEKSSARQWGEWLWIKTAQWSKKLFGKREQSNASANNALDLKFQTGELKK